MGRNDSGHDQLRKRLLANVIDSPIGDKAEDMSDLLASEWSPAFERLMRNRMVVGRYRYGRMDRKERLNYDRVGNAIQRLHAYLTAGNLEHLVDAANLLMLEFEHGEHPQRHFSAADDSEHVAMHID